MKVRRPEPKTVQQVPAVLKRQVTTNPGGLPALPEEWEEQLAVAAKDEAAQEQPTTQAFSLRAGQLSYNGQVMPDNKMRVIVVAYSFENAFFINKFDPNNIIPPLCFALSEDGKDMEPHDNSRKKQNETCLSCPQAEWGSDENSPSGRGKACKEVRRLAVIPDQALEDGIDKAAIAMLRVPVTSVRNWSEYVHTLSAIAKRPAWTVVTEISVVPDAKNQFAVKFTPVDAVVDPEQLTLLQAARQRALQSVMNPYAMMTDEQFKEITEEAAKPAKKRKF